MEKDRAEEGEREVLSGNVVGHHYNVKLDVDEAECVYSGRVDAHVTLKGGRAVTMHSLDLSITDAVLAVGEVRREDSESHWERGS